MTLTEAVRFAIRHAKPAAGTISVTKAIELALREKGKGKRPSYVADLRKRWKRFERWLPPKGAARSTGTMSIGGTRIEIAPNFFRQAAFSSSWASKRQGKEAANDFADFGIEWLFLCRRPSGKILPENFRRKRWALCYCDELERGMAGRHFETFLWLLPSRKIPQRRAHCRSNGAQERADALCALSRGREKFPGYHRLLDGLSARRRQSNQVRGVIARTGLLKLFVNGYETCGSFPRASVAAIVLLVGME